MTLPVTVLGFFPVPVLPVLIGYRITASLQTSERPVLDGLL
jgi:hypothetical protein